MTREEADKIVLGAAAFLEKISKGSMILTQSLKDDALALSQELTRVWINAHNLGTDVKDLPNLFGEPGSMSQMLAKLHDTDSDAGNSGTH